MKTAVIYSNGSQECNRMASLLKNLDGIVTFLEYKVGNDFTEQQFQMEFGSDASYPQVNIGTQHVGNMNETLKYMGGRGMFS
mgnify:FL=1|jgi:hypothetical protein